MSRKEVRLSWVQVLFPPSKRALGIEPSKTVCMCVCVCADIETFMSSVWPLDRGVF